MTKASYSVLPSDDFGEGSIKLVSIKAEHIESIRIWRNAQMKVLRQSAPITREQQLIYFKDNVLSCKTESNPNQILFAIHDNGSFVGYGGLVHISWLDKRSEISFLLTPEIRETSKRYAYIFIGFLSVIKSIAFDALSLHRLFTETYSFRKDHILTLEHSGFIYEGLLRDHVTVDNQYVDSLIHGCINT